MSPIDHPLSIFHSRGVTGTLTSYSLPFLGSFLVTLPVGQVGLGWAWAKGRFKLAGREKQKPVSWRVRPGTGARLLPGQDASCSPENWGWVGEGRAAGPARNRGSQRSSLLVTSGAHPLQSPPYQRERRQDSCVTPTSGMKVRATESTVDTLKSCQSALTYQSGPWPIREPLTSTNYTRF